MLIAVFLEQIARSELYQLDGLISCHLVCVAAYQPKVAPHTSLSKTMGCSTQAPGLVVDIKVRTSPSTLKRLKFDGSGVDGGRCRGMI